MQNTNKNETFRGCLITCDGKGGWEWMVHNREGQQVTAALTLQKAKNVVKKMYPENQ